jgi:lipopolysaccharide export system protein LptA
MGSWVQRCFGIVLLLMSLGVSQDSSSQDSGQPATQQPAETSPSSSSEETQPAPNQSSEQPTPAPSETTENQKKLNLTKLTIKRKDRNIIVSQTASGAEGGKQFLNAKECDEKDRSLLSSTFFAPDPYLIETQVNEATLTSRIAASRQPPNKKDADGNTIEKGNDKAILELYGGTLEFPDERSGCPKNIKRSDQADVTLKQGRTTVTGLNFLYDNNKGIGNMKGPITLDRVAEGDSPALNATSDTMQINVDDNKTFLEGNVKVTSEDRVSEAATLEYNEDDGLAILRGDKEKGIPAKSTKGNDVTQGDIIIYYLDTNDVKILGNVQGEIEVDLEDGTTSDNTDGSSTDGNTPETDTGTTNNDGANP